jgi:hypothetical protein
MGVAAEGAGKETFYTGQQVHLGKDLGPQSWWESIQE